MKQELKRSDCYARSNPWPAGGGTDVAMRALGEAVAKHLGQRERLDQERWYLSTDEYAKYARETFIAERAAMERLGLKQ